MILKLTRSCLNKRSGINFYPPLVMMVMMVMMVVTMSINTDGVTNNSNSSCNQVTTHSAV